ncbi:MAG: M56 family metallopeptidase [Candidatus Eisenbacteria bacterium]|uniref:M56 family metallopeptidase n=1 Tax=Eiseniibacteriota bacterium TaxID=2212470 RepID=A0A849SES7_UNCEI|nr:M56 family metallopeptidase [Candidatus Eisenbacteria bacterium]
MIEGLIEGGVRAGIASTALLVALALFRRTSAAFRAALLSLALLMFAIAALPGFALPVPVLLRPVAWSGAAPRLTASFEWLVGVVWCVGALWVAARTWSGRRRLARESVGEGLEPETDELAARVRAAATRLAMRPPRVVVSRTATSPYVWGMRSPVLVMPAGWTARLDDRSMQLLLRHELAHVRRGDTRWLGLAGWLAIVWWWHPVFWLVVARLRAAQDDASDDLALHGECDAAANYCDMLLRAARLTLPERQSVLGPAGLGVHALESRLRRLMQSPESRRARLATGHWLLIAALALLLLPGVSPASRHSQAPALHRHSHSHSHSH